MLKNINAILTYMILVFYMLSLLNDSAFLFLHTRRVGVQDFIVVFMMDGAARPFFFKYASVIKD